MTLSNGVNDRDFDSSTALAWTSMVQLCGLEQILLRPTLSLCRTTPLNPGWSCSMILELTKGHSLA